MGVSLKLSNSVSYKLVHDICGNTIGSLNNQLDSQNSIGSVEFNRSIPLKISAFIDKQSQHLDDHHVISSDNKVSDRIINDKLETESKSNNSIAIKQDSFSSFGSGRKHRTKQQQHLQEQSPIQYPKRAHSQEPLGRSTVKISGNSLWTMSTSSSLSKSNNSNNNMIQPRKTKSQQFFSSKTDLSQLPKYLPFKGRRPVTAKDLSFKTSANSTWLQSYRHQLDNRSSLDNQCDISLMITVSNGYNALSLRFNDNALQNDILEYKDKSSQLSIQESTQIPMALAQLQLKNALITCQDLNKFSLESGAANIILGLSNGELLCYNQLAGTYIRINKGGYWNHTNVICVKWISETVFLAGYANGQAIMYDTERRDIPEFKKRKSDTQYTSDSDADDQSQQQQPPQSQQQSKSSVYNCSPYLRIATNPARSTRFNPCEVWQFIPPARSIDWGKHAGPNQNASERIYTKPPIITDIAIASNGLVAVTLSRGHVYILSTHEVSENINNNTCIIAIHMSRYGGFLCCTWSADSKLLACGGQDDTIYIYDCNGLISRLDGHESWVTDVIFDSCIRKNVYRLFSGGEDRKVCYYRVEYYPEMMTQQINNAWPRPQDSNAPMITEDWGEKNAQILSPTNWLSFHKVQTGVSNIELLDEGNFMVVTFRDGHIKIWKISK